MPSGAILEWEHIYVFLKRAMSVQVYLHFLELNIAFSFFFFLQEVGGAEKYVLSIGLLYNLINSLSITKQKLRFTNRDQLQINLLNEEN